MIFPYYHSYCGISTYLTFPCIAENLLTNFKQQKPGCFNTNNLEVCLLNFLQQRFKAINKHQQLAALTQEVPDTPGPGNLDVDVQHPRHPAWHGSVYWVEILKSTWLTYLEGTAWTAGKPYTEYVEYVHTTIWDNYRAIRISSTNPRRFWVPTLIVGVRPAAGFKSWIDELPMRTFIGHVPLQRLIAAGYLPSGGWVLNRFFSPKLL